MFNDEHGSYSKHGKKGTLGSSTLIEEQFF